MSKKIDKVNLQSAFQELFGESDRAAAIIAATLLDHALELLLRKFLVDDEKEVENLTGGGSNPLSFFGAKMMATYCMGLISRIELDQLRQINKIRRLFAHQFVNDFENQQIQALCSLLIYNQKINELFPAGLQFSSKQYFCFSVSLLYTLLLGREGRIQKRPLLKEQVLEWRDHP